MGRGWRRSFYFDRGRFVQVPDLPGGNISSIAGDGHGKVWISNLGEGLFYSTPEGVVQHIPWADSNTNKGRELCCLIGCTAAYGSDFSTAEWHT